MESKGRIRHKVMQLVMFILISIIPQTSFCQTVSYLNDKSKTYQLRSMENGKWEFQPGGYYYLLHKKYSGAYMSGFHYKFSVEKSTEKQIAALRASEIPLENLAAKRIQQQVDTIKNLAQEETIRSAERMVDLMYMQYESIFKDTFAKINELTGIINTNSNGDLLNQALVIIDEKDLLQAEIDYIHETGPTKQMEQAKRQLAYEEVLKKLKKLLNYSYRVAYYSQTLNNLKK